MNQIHTKSQVNPYRVKISSIYIFKDWLRPELLHRQWTEEEARAEAMRRYEEAIIIRGSKDVRVVGYPSDYDPRLLCTYEKRKQLLEQTG